MGQLTAEMGEQRAPLGADEALEEAQEKGYAESTTTFQARNTRIKSLDGVGSGNAVTSVSKSGTKITFTKGSTFSLNGHTHTFASLTSKPTSLSGYGITDGVNAVSVTGSGNAH
jgi:hypothetical protein